MFKFGYKAMYKFILASSLCLIFMTAKAQDKRNVVSDTTEITIGNKVISIISDSSKDGKDIHVTTVSRRNGGQAEKQEGGYTGNEDGEEKKKRKAVEVEFLNLDLGMNFLTTSTGFNLPNAYEALEIKPLNSSHVGIHLLKTKFRMARGHVNLITGITLDNNRFAFQNNITLIPGQDSLTIFQDSISFRKNKLITWHAQIPLLLKFETNPDNKRKNFHFAAGGYAGLLIGSTMKQKSNEVGKTKRHDDYNLEKFRYGVMGRIGFRGVEFYAAYDLTSMFRENQGPNIQPVRFGLSITGPM